MIQPHVYKAAIENGKTIEFRLWWYSCPKRTKDTKEAEERIYGEMLKNLSK